MLDRNIRFAAKCGLKAEGSLLAAPEAVLDNESAVVKIAASILDQGSVSLRIKTESHKENGGLV